MTSAADTLDRARQETGFDDFGEDCFREGLERLLAAVDAEARLSDHGRKTFYALVVNRLANRLKVEHWYTLHPEIDEQEVVRPLIGLGLPRTGSTALFHLLAADPAARFIRVWEGLSPCPPPEAATEHDDPRVIHARTAMAHRDQAQPRKKSMLPMTINSPLECGTFMCYDFKSQFFQSLAHIPSYVEWLIHEADLVPTYRYHKRILKLLQWRRPPVRWRLKNPSHCQFIGALDESYPDARYWMTHRDITKVIPSVADLYFEQYNEYSDDVDKAAIGRLNMETWELAMRRMIAFRDEGNEHRFVDVQFAAFQQDPFPSLQRLYNFLGEDLTPETRARMQAWRDETPRDKHGSHEFDAADFALDGDELRSRFAFYTNRFGPNQQSSTDAQVI